MSKVEERLSCRACGSPSTRMFYEVPNVPVNTVLLLSSRQEAIDLATGNIKLCFCASCGFIFNAAFDPNLVEYSPRCEETQGFSADFRKWHEALAARLISRHHLHNKSIIEIGCGKGEFLTLLCALGHNQGIGFDPAYVKERSRSDQIAAVEFITSKYSPEYARSFTADFLCCKMTLEHIHNADGFIQQLRRSLDHLPNAVIFLQVPNGQKILKDIAFWDVYYEHCSYYTAGSLTRLLSRNGFRVLDTGLDFGEQYLIVEARPAPILTAPPIDEMEDLRAIQHAVSRFARELPPWLSDWRQRLRQCKKASLRVVVWGSGSKGAAFLTAVDLDGYIDYVVDINPHRQGHYMAKTGQQIVGPEFLREYQPQLVLLMNPIYLSEISTELRHQAVDAQILTLEYPL
jgi:SAM-dependent methyltransferase